MIFPQPLPRSQDSIFGFNNEFDSVKTLKMHEEVDTTKYSQFRHLQDGRHS